MTSNNVSRVLHKVPYTVYIHRHKRILKTFNWKKSKPVLTYILFFLVLFKFQYPCSCSLEYRILWYYFSSVMYVFLGNELVIYSVRQWGIPIHPYVRPKSCWNQPLQLTLSHMSVQHSLKALGTYLNGNEHYLSVKRIPLYSTVMMLFCLYVNNLRCCVFGSAACLFASNRAQLNRTSLYMHCSCRK